MAGWGREESEVVSGIVSYLLNLTRETFGKGCDAEKLLIESFGNVNVIAALLGAMAVRMRGL